MLLSWCIAVLRCLVAAVALFAAGNAHAVAATSDSGVRSFTLANGMQVVVVPDHRLPVVTHMVWYRVGAADGPPGQSGLAHFLEHLMFKSTRRLGTGEFTRIVNSLGGRHNALTTHDTTSYFQRVAKPHLCRLMELEADRMTNLTLADPEVETERGVVREERRGSVDAQPIAALNELMMAALYQNHPYRRPVLGWPDEIAQFTRDDAEAFYRQHYAPNNAVLVVAGDVTPGEVLDIALVTYGKVPANPAVAERRRPSEPRALAARHLRLEDARVGGPMVLRYYPVPGVRAPAAERASLAVLARILGGDETSRLYRRLVLEKKLAAQSGADAQVDNLDGGRLALLALGDNAADPRLLEVEMNAVIAELVRDGVNEEEVARAKLVLEAAHVFDTDDQEKRARRYGRGVANGLTVAEIDDELKRLAAVTPADVLKAAKDHLVARHSVTGILIRPGRKTGRNVPPTAIGGTGK